MAIYCSKCGKELPDDAEFCVKCGKPVGSTAKQAVEPEPRWEYCEIVFSVKYSPQNAKLSFKEKLELMGHRYYDIELWAEGLGPHGRFEIARGMFIGHTHDKGEYQSIYDQPVSTGQDDNVAVNNLTSYLIQQGWEPLPSKGAEWYSYKFRRQVKGAEGSGGGPKHTTAPISSSASQASPTPNSVVIPPLPPPPAPTPAKPKKRLSMKLVVGSLFYGGLVIWVVGIVTVNMGSSEVAYDLLFGGAFFTLAGVIMALVNTIRERRVGVFVLTLLLPIIGVGVYCAGKGEYQKSVPQTSARPLSRRTLIKSLIGVVAVAGVAAAVGIGVHLLLSPSPNKRTLYMENGSDDWKDWAGGDFQVNDDMTMTVADGYFVYAPIQIPEGTNIAIETTIQVETGADPAAASGTTLFSIVYGGSPDGGFVPYNVQISKGQSGPSVVVEDKGPKNGPDFTFGPSGNTYRVEIRGENWEQVRVFVDGNLQTEGTTIQNAPSGNQVGLWANSIPIKVMRFNVYAI